MYKKCFIAGLPSAGKTTFLAALWNLINHDPDAKLKLNKIENGQYLASLAINGLIWSLWKEPFRLVSKQI